MKRSTRPAARTRSKGKDSAEASPARDESVPAPRKSRAKGTGKPKRAKSSRSADSSLADDLGRPARSAPRVAEFFAGIGLMRLGLDQAGFQVEFANDIDPDKHEIYAANFEASHFRLGDIHALTADDVPRCDLFTASFPCNDLSVAGARKGIHAGESSAFWGFLEILRGLGEERPRMVLLENVPGFLSSNEGRDFEAAIAGLNELGYACDALMLDAVTFTPQSRLRMFVVAKLGVEGAYPFGLRSSAVRPEPLTSFMLSHPNLTWDVARLPAPQPLDRRLPAILEDLPDDDPSWWDAERVEYFMNQLSDRHLAAAQEMIAGKEVTYGTAFRRVRKGRSMAELRTDGIAGCLRTPRGGSGRQILFKAGQGRRQVRLLSPRECARLQGVPDSFRLDVPANQALFGFGDAVCVPVIAWIAENYLAPCLTRAAERPLLPRG